MVEALARFGAPLDDHGVSQADFERPGTVYQLGQPPRRIDLLTSISGVGFDEAEAEAVLTELDGLEVPVLGRRHLVANKLAAGRPKDLVDAELLSRGEERS